MKPINVSGPWITQKEIDYVTDAVTNAWYSQANVYHQKFEKAFASYVGRKYAVALPSCTSALHLALLGLGIGNGDEVIVPESTWIATSAPISYVGASPVFADVDEDSWCITPKSLKERITARTKAVIVVDLYGNMPRMNEILQIARENGLVVVEDAAEAVGSEYQGKKAGSFGEASTFSFHGSKTLTTGEGGMLLTNDDNLYERVLSLRDHGRDMSSEKMFWNSEVAFKYKMSSMQAALGLAQLERIDELIARKRQIFDWYRTRLSNVEGLQLNCEEEDVLNTFWMVTLVLDERIGIAKEQLILALKSRNIDARPFFYPLSALPAYSRLAQNGAVMNPVSYRLGTWGVNLPSGLNLDEPTVNFVCESVSEILEGSCTRASS